MSQSQVSRHGTDTVPKSWRPIVGDELTKPYYHTLQDFLTAERRAHTVYPPRARRLQRAPAHILRGRAGVDPGAGPLSRRGTGARVGLLGPTGRQASAIVSQHLQGVARRPGLPRPQQRRPRALVRAGRPASQQRPHGTRTQPRLAPRQGLGNLHGHYYSCGRRQGRPHRLCAVGRFRAEKTRPN